MADEKKIEVANVKVKVKGPGSITYGKSVCANVGDTAVLTASEYESVKELVEKI